ncbi:hypothetical protein OS493_025266 [Desmophyllum pertusum]|uniref:Uncharacterized protein n=1 Tax=Desmophyllum pertusum TaxID=174260 RepID=A0A9X0CWB6_9CNID|nr:hypothetical protein OS493_025266 [Desmophyllum pertusum]
MAFLSSWMWVILSAILTTDNAIAPNPIYGNNDQFRVPSGGNQVLRTPSLRLGTPMSKNAPSLNVGSVILNSMLTTDNVISPNPIYGNNQQFRVPCDGKQVLRTLSLRLRTPMSKNAPSQNFGSAPSFQNEQSVPIANKPVLQYSLQKKPHKTPAGLDMSQQLQSPIQSEQPPQQTTQCDQTKPATKKKDGTNNNNNCGGGLAVASLAVANLAVVSLAVASHVAAVSHAAVAVIKTFVIITSTITIVACIMIVACITCIMSLKSAHNHAAADVHSLAAADVHSLAAADVHSLAAADVHSLAAADVLSLATADVHSLATADTLSLAIAVLDANADSWTLSGCGCPCEVNPCCGCGYTSECGGYHYDIFGNGSEEPGKRASNGKREQKGDRRQLILPPGYLFPAYQRVKTLQFLKRTKVPYSKRMHQHMARLRRYVTPFHFWY